MSSSPEVTTTIVDDNPAVYEHRHVHAVYDQIAPHFSSTRYKVVKISSPFVATLNGNSLGPLSRSFYRAFQPAGSGLIREREMVNIYPYPQTIQEIFGRLGSIEVKAY